MAKLQKYEQIEEAIIHGASRALTGSVKKIVEQELLEQAKKAKRDPKIARSWIGRNNGLGTKQNIVSTDEEYYTYGKDALVFSALYVKDVTKPQESFFKIMAKRRKTPNVKIRDIERKEETLFSEWINDGTWMDLSLYFKQGCPPRGKRPYRAKRPYVDVAFENICKNNEIISEIERNMY